jgi:hypothetical protein
MGSLFACSLFQDLYEGSGRELARAIRFWCAITVNEIWCECNEIPVGSNGTWTKVGQDATITDIDKP